MMRDSTLSDKGLLILRIMIGAACLLPLAVAAGPAQSRPSGLDKIEHVIVLMQENRSFDHYLGQLPDYAASRGITLDLEPAPDPGVPCGPNPSQGRPCGSNPDPIDPARQIPVFHQTHVCDVMDVSHSWNATHLQWNNGAMDGFTSTNQYDNPLDGPGDTLAEFPDDLTGSRAMGYYTDQELPFYYDLYSTFAMADRYFSSLPGPTFPNRFYLLAGTSWVDTANTNEAETRNRLDDIASGPGFAGRSIFNLLDEAGISWKVYASEPPLAFANSFFYVRSRAANVVHISQYFADAAAGTLPKVAYIDPIFIAPRNVQNDEHSPANVQVGQHFVATVINALFDSPAWSSTAFFLIYDEHGGYFDHVPPPHAVPPDDHPPMHDDPGGNDLVTLGHGTLGFDRYGIRLPAAVVSPFSKKHFVSHDVYDHASVLRFIETRFGLPPLTRRDAKADPMLALFDFENPAFMSPPTLQPAVIDGEGYAECDQLEITSPRSP